MSRHGNVQQPKPFDNWEEAYNYCREIDAPCVVEVEGEVNRIYPSGHKVYLRGPVKEVAAADHLREGGGS